MSGVTTATVIAGVGAAATVASTGMSILGGVQQSAAQRQAGENAYQNALIRNQQQIMQAAELRNEAVQRRNEATLQDNQAGLQDNQAVMLESQAKQQEDAATLRGDQANAQQAVAQRAAIDAKRTATITAGRARAVMAASGGGVDERLVAGILGEGDYGRDVALYQGDTAAQGSRYAADLGRADAANTRYGAGVTRYQAGVTRFGASTTRYQALLDEYQANNQEWVGQTDVAMGDRARLAYDTRADNTLIQGIGTGFVKGLSLAAQYGSGPAPGDIADRAKGAYGTRASDMPDIDREIAEWSLA